MLALSGTEYYLLCVMGAALVLILSNRIAPDLVAMMVLLALGLGGVVTLEQAVSGFSNPAVITIIGLFVITSTLEQTGVILWLSRYLARLAGTTEVRLILVLMTAGALFSLVVNNIAAGAVLLPIALRLARQASVRPSKVLLPLAFGTLVGGMATLFTTANIVLSAQLQEQGYSPLTMLDFLGTGGVVALAGIAYMALVGRHLLPQRESAVRIASLLEPAPDLSKTYELDQRLWEGVVLPGSPLHGTLLRDSNLGSRLGITVLAIWRDYRTRLVFSPDERIAVNDVLIVLGREERVRQLETLAVHVNQAAVNTHTASIRELPAHEVIIAPRSPVIGRTLVDLQFRTNTGLTAVAIWRGTRSYRTDVGTMPLQAGDALLLMGTAAAIEGLADEPGYIVPEVLHMPAPGPYQAILSALIAALAIGISMAGVVPTPEAMLLGAVLLVLTRCIRMDEVYSAVEWRIVFLIAGMAPFSIALQETGLAERLGQFFTATLTPLGPLGIIAGFYLFTFLVTQVLGGQVTSLVVGPLAITAAIQAQVNPSAMGVAVAIACSASFLTPVAHPVNLLMMNPGGYTSGDFLRLGSGMSLVCFVALLVALPLFWPL